MKMHCYKITVETTNGANDTFKTAGKYHNCLQKTVYVIASDVYAAAGMIPEAKIVSYMGPAFVGEDRHG